MRLGVLMFAALDEEDGEGSEDAEAQAKRLSLHIPLLPEEEPRR